MNKTIHILLTTELIEKVQTMKNNGFNISVLIRNFLMDFPLEKNSEKCA